MSNETLKLLAPECIGYQLTKNAVSAIQISALSLGVTFISILQIKMFFFSELGERKKNLNPASERTCLNLIANQTK